MSFNYKVTSGSSVVLGICLYFCFLLFFADAVVLFVCLLVIPNSALFLFHCFLIQMFLLQFFSQIDYENRQCSQQVNTGVWQDVYTYMQRYKHL